MTNKGRELIKEKRAVIKITALFVIN